jgi:hypothetical protein
MSREEVVLFQFFMTRVNSGPAQLEQLAESLFRARHGPAGAKARLKPD